MLVARYQGANSLRFSSGASTSRFSSLAGRMLVARYQGANSDAFASASRFSSLAGRILVARYQGANSDAFASRFSSVASQMLVARYQGAHSVRFFSEAATSRLSSVAGRIFVAGRHMLENRLIIGLSNTYLCTKVRTQYASRKPWLQEQQLQEWRGAPWHLQPR